MPAQDRVGPYEQQEVAQFVLGEVVEQAGEDGEIGVGEVRLPDLALEDQQLVPQREDLDVLVSVAHGQEAQERQGVGRGEVGEAQQHDRS